jgi:RimJ/RimL family protein N-acetyltransferase
MLRGEKVILRAVERGELKRMQELQQDVELTALANGAWDPRPLAAFEKSFDKRLDDDEHSWFGIEADGKLIGYIGLHHRDRRDGIAAVGIGIQDRDYVGKGYGRDALRLLLDWAFRIQNYRRIWLDTLATNERALRAYRSCGFIEEGRMRLHYYYDGSYHDAIIMGILRSEWEAGRKAAGDTASSSE